MRVLCWFCDDLADMEIFGVSVCGDCAVRIFNPFGLNPLDTSGPSKLNECRLGAVADTIGKAVEMVDV